MKITNIVWDLEIGESDFALPKKIEIPVELQDKDYDTIVDWVLDEYGYRICSCDIEEE